jgi:Arc/MetJ-type ribon-helix-helix transcriptional regulator
MGSTRTHVVLPEELIREIDALVGKRGRSEFLAEVATREVKRRKLIELLEQPGPIWKSEDHPELKGGAAAWVRKMRREDEKLRVGKAAGSRP